MPAPRKYDQETRDRAVRLYWERCKSDPAESMIASRRHVGGLLGLNPETLRGWIEREEVNAGTRPGVSDTDSEQVKALRKENAEPRRANEILRVASVHSRGRCNACLQDSGGGFESEDFAWSGVELGRERVKVGVAVQG